MNNNKLFSKVSHDLRGSFTSILGFSDIMNDPEENLSSEEIHEFVKRIGNQTKESFDLLVNFINWLKLKSFDYGIVKEKIDLTEMILNIQSLNKKKFTDKEIKINNTVTDSIFVEIDYEILNTIVANLFSYLIEAADTKSSINLAPIEDNKNFAGISIIFQPNNELDYLNDLSEINSEIPYSILFAHEFVKLSGGKLVINKGDKKKLNMTVLLPK